MDGLEVAHRRLVNQHLVGAPLPDPVATVRWFGAMQAQEYTVAKWSIGQRTHGCDDRVVQRALDDGAIVRTHALRPTWHFVAAEDVAWIQALTGPRVHALNAYHYRRHGLDETILARTNAAIAAALRGGRHLTRAVLAEVVRGAGVEATGNRLAYVVIRAELDGLVVNGPMRGRQHTYALLAERVPRPRAMAPDEALAELTRRYFTSHGPATAKDFSWWSSLTLAQARRGLALVGTELASSTVDGVTYWYPPGEAPGRPGSPDVHILQGFDEVVVAYTESRPLLNLAGLSLPGGANGVRYPIMVDGQLAGSWRRTVERGHLVVRAALVVRVTVRLRRAVEAAFARYGAFAGVPVTVEWPAS